MVIRPFRGLQKQRVITLHRIAKDVRRQVISELTEEEEAVKTLVCSDRWRMCFR